MSIIFKKITYKNFLSTGNVPNTFILNSSRMTLIIGKNANGKSSMIDAICFALFGKAFRNITKPQLINSINQKQCLVEIEFDIDDRQYKVIRGIKPNVFEIWCNGVIMNQDAASKDYQKILEQQILRLNYKTFTQVVILGAASFVPFMQLPAWQRREVIEDILDIRIFSIMNQMLKSRVQENKDEIQRIEDAIILAKEKVNAQKKLISTITAARESTNENLEKKIVEALEQIRSATIVQESLGEEVAKLMSAASEESSIKSDLRKITVAKTKLESRYDTIQEKISFLEESEECPACTQKIPHEHKHKTIGEAQETLVKYEDERKTLDTCLEKLNTKLEKITELNKELTQKNIELSTAHNTISILNKQISQLNAEIQSHKKDTQDIDAEKDRLKTLAENAVTMLDAKAQLAEQKNLQEIASLLLKDTGVKTAIIREYLPIMNKLINKYLNIMDSYIHFELDESFNEIIKSRYRDEFTYASFSEGEKQRVDLAILFAWRQIAKMKNSVNTNLLIFDEIMDSSLDVSGTDCFMGLLNTFGEDTNIYVISHKGEAIIDKFSNVICVEKKNDFSLIVDKASVL